MNTHARATESQTSCTRAHARLLRGQVSVFSPKALRSGAEVTVVANAVTDAQRAALSDGSLPPEEVWRALAPDAHRGARAACDRLTAFETLQARRVAHVDVPEVCTRVWICITGMRLGRCSSAASATPFGMLLAEC